MFVARETRETQLAHRYIYICIFQIYLQNKPAHLAFWKTLSLPPASFNAPAHAPDTSQDTPDTIRYMYLIPYRLTACPCWRSSVRSRRSINNCASVCLPGKSGHTHFLPFPFPLRGNETPHRSPDVLALNSSVFWRNIWTFCGQLWPPPSI